MSKIPKSAAGYMHKYGTDYICAECVAYDPEDRRCLHLGPGDIVLPFDGSNFFEKGEPGSIQPSEPELALDEDQDSAMSLLTPQQIGFARSNFGFGCRRCSHFMPGLDDCNAVDRESPGDDPGRVDPHACCNLWEPDSRRANMPDVALEALLAV